MKNLLVLVQESQRGGSIKSRMQKKQLQPLVVKEWGQPPSYRKRWNMWRWGTWRGDTEKTFLQNSKKIKKNKKTSSFRNRLQMYNFSSLEGLKTWSFEETYIIYVKNKGYLPTFLSKLTMKYVMTPNIMVCAATYGISTRPCWILTTKKLFPLYLPIINIYD